MMSRSVLTVPLLLLATQVAQAWNSVTFRVLNLTGDPDSSAVVSYQYHTGDGGPYSFTKKADSKGNVYFDGGGAGFDSIWRITVTDTFQRDTFKIAGTVTLAQMNAGTAGNDSSSKYDYLKISKLPFYTWTPSTLASDSGSFIIPGVPQQIIYDPPGDGSYASLSKGSSFQSSVTTSFGYGAGASLTAGYSFDAGVASADVEVSASVDYKHNTDNNFTATVTTNSAMNTGTNTDPSVVGPGRGDLFVVPTLTMKWHLYRSYVPTDPKAYSDGYVYRLFYHPVAAAQNALRILNASSIRSAFDTATAARLLGASVIDPTTHRIRDSLVNHSTGVPKTSRLTLLNSLQSLYGGGGSSEQDSTGTVSQAVTVSYSVDIGATASAKVSVGGATAGATVSANLTMGSQSGSTTTYNRTIAMSLSDANPWDVLTYRIYRDNAYGVYVWDVDSTQSWTSLPFEAGYSSPSIAWKASNDHDTLRVPAGTDTVFHLHVENLDRHYPGLDTLAVAATVVKTSGLSATIDPSGFQVPVDSTGTTNLSVSAPNAGTYSLVVNLVGTVNASAVAASAFNVYDTVVLVAGTSSTRERLGGGAALVRTGRELSIRVVDGVPWSLRVEDLRGRVLADVSGTGSARVPAPSGSGASVSVARLRTPDASRTLTWTEF
jgi:hypothetical protein